MVFIGQWNRKQSRYSSRSSAIAAFSARLGLVCVALSISTLKYVRSATRGQRRTPRILTKKETRIILLIGRWSNHAGGKVSVVRRKFKRGTGVH